MSIDLVCNVCQNTTQSGLLVPLKKCGHRFHYDCLIIDNLNKNSSCPTCQGHYDELFYTTSQSMTTTTRLMVKNYFNEFRIGQSHLMDYKIVGYSYLFGKYFPFSNNNSFSLQINIQHSQISWYCFGTTLDNIHTVTEFEFDAIYDQLFPRSLNHCVFTLKPTVAIDNILRLNVQILPSPTKVAMFLCKILVKDGLKENQFPGIMEMNSIAQYLPTRNNYLIRPLCSFKNKLSL